MKKYILALVLGGVLSASAVSLKWNGAGASAKMYGLTTESLLSVGDPSETSSIVVYFLEASNFGDLSTEYVSKANFLKDNSSLIVATAIGQTATSDSASGRVVASDINTDYTTANNEFFARVYATIGGTEYMMNAFGGLGTDGVWVNTKSGDQSTEEKLAWQEGTYGGSVTDVASAKNVWIKAAVVPEPATAALALLGIGMLIRRRRRA